jgi:hypothetical protein
MLQEALMFISIDWLKPLAALLMKIGDERLAVRLKLHLTQ